MSASASRRSAKAGIRGLCPCFVLFAALVCSIGIAAAEPLLIEVVTSEATVDQRTAQPVVSLKLSEKSARLLVQLTQDNVGRVMHLRVDGKVVMSPVIREPILQGSLQISGSFTAKEAKDIVDSIKAGSKVELEIESK